jgi:transcriptional regulator with XRE-family HTH domain
MNEFQKYVFDGLNETKLTQRELAKQSSTTEVTISRIMSGDVKKPSNKVSFNIQYALVNNDFKWFEKEV